MPLAERRERHAALFANLCDYDIDRWHREFLAALHGPPDMQASSGAVAIDDADWPRSSAA
jgi:trehalose-6-phosphate synthase